LRVMQCGTNHGKHFFLCWCSLSYLSVALAPGTRDVVGGLGCDWRGFMSRNFLQMKLTAAEILPLQA
jgi:hypothetical protein